MMNYKINICYCGTDFCGYQLQPGQRTVSGEIRIVLDALFSEYKHLAGCSRTDSGVHANDYCLSFSSEKVLPCDVVERAMNNKLPLDIRVKNVEYVPSDFHARYSVTEKEYLYMIDNGSYSSPFLKNRALFYPKSLDLVSMNQAASMLVGTHDFSAFRAHGSEDKDPVRTIKSAYFTKTGDLVLFHISADGFLYKMVRLCTGYMIRVSERKLSLDDIELMLKTGKSKYPYTVDACGLYLNQVCYE